MKVQSLFLRSVRLSSGSAQSVDRTWSSPCPPKIQPWNFCRVQDKLYSRLHYVQLHTGVKGLAVCCLHGRNVGIYAFSNASRDYKGFINNMKQRFKGRHLCWMFFPFNAGESIRNIWIRQFRDCEGEASNPVIGVSVPPCLFLSGLNVQLQLGTSQLRTITFGPYIPPYLRHMLRFHSLVRNGDGIVSGFCHNGLDPEARYISEVGVTCNPHYAIESMELEPSFDLYLPPPITPRGGFPTTSWYMTKAPLQGLFEVQFCQDKDRLHHPCIGLLLHYETGCVESLGQVRWDQGISDKIPAPIRIQRSNSAGNDYIRNVQGSTPSNSKMAEDGWQEIPKHGIIVWWFGHIGDQLAVYDT
jgi:hypothetical protein